MCLCCQKALLQPHSTASAFGKHSRVPAECQQSEKSDCGTTQNVEIILNKRKSTTLTPHICLFFFVMGKVVEYETTQKTIAVTVRVFLKKRFTKVEGVSSLQLKPDFTHADKSLEFQKYCFYCNF